jgi:hypothetical protein
MNETATFLLQTYDPDSEECKAPYAPIRVEAPGGSHLRVFLGSDPFKPPGDQVCPDLRIERQDGKWLIVVHQDEGDATCGLTIPDDPEAGVVVEKAVGGHQHNMIHEGTVEFRR